MLTEQISSLVEEKKQELADYVALDSVSSENRKLWETAEYVRDLIQAHGGKSRILNDLGGPPFVYGEFEPGPQGRSDRTLLVYCHYDVQPVEPLEEWKSDPFVMTERDGYWYGRGVYDDKGNLFARLLAIDLLNQAGGLPCRVKFFLEGTEESGSRMLSEYVKHYADLLSSDACVWESGAKTTDEKLQISCGLKGSAYIRLSVQTAKADLHSSQGAVAQNAAWRLVQALATIRSKDNRITVDHFYDLMEEPNQELLDLAEAMPYDEQAEREASGLLSPLITEDLDLSPQEALMLYPTCTITGIHSGYTGDGAKTIVPARAQADLDFRLVPGYHPEDVLDLVRKHLDRRGFDDVETELILGIEPYRSDLSDPFVETVVKAAEKVYGQGQYVLSANMFGSGPMAPFGQYLDNLPILAFGIGNAGSSQHAPNENIKVTDLYQGIQMFAQVLADFAGV